MTTDTLEGHVRAYRAGTINLKDHAAMVEELVARREIFGAALNKLAEGFDTMRDEFINSLDGDS